MTRLKISKVSFAAALLLGSSAICSTQAQDIDQTTLDQLRQIIEQQQEQLQNQAATIEALKQRVDQIDAATDAAVAASALAIDEAEEVKEEVEAAEGRVPDQFIGAVDNKLALSISGQINRAVNIADDGADTKAYFVDNDVTNSRLRIVGTAQLSPETTAGTNFETAFSPNNSYDVSQENESSDDFIDVRKVEAFVVNEKLGQLTFGKGSAAADDTAEYDLSLVAGPIMYAGIADVVGGLELTEDGALTGITLGDAFFDFDGGRQNRVRYDTPVLFGAVQASVSAGDDQRYDAALNWGGDYGNWSGVDLGPVTTLGAISIQDPSEQNVDYRVAGSFSAIHNPSGLGLTLSAGGDSHNERDPYNIYGKLSWDTKFFSLGSTGFGIDYAYNEDTIEDGSEGMSVGLAGIQLIEDFGAELYGAFRVFKFSRDNVNDPDDVYVGTVGTRVKF